VNPTDPQFPTSNMRVLPQGMYSQDYMNARNQSENQRIAATASGAVAQHMQDQVDAGTPAYTVKINGEGY